MWSWLKLGRSPTPPVRPLASSVRPMPPPPPGPFVAPEAAAQAVEPLEGLGHRRPLVGRNGHVAGFELLLAPAVERRLAARGDSPSVLLHYSALLTAAATITAGGRAALVRLPALLLNRPKLAEVASAQTLLLVDDLAAVPPKVCAALRARGVRLGVPDGPPSAALKPDFVVLQASAGGIDTLLLSAQRWREQLPNVTLVGLGMQHLEDLEGALRGGLTFAGGQIGQSRERPVSRPLGAAAHRIAGLLNHLALDLDTAVIADEVRADATLDLPPAALCQQPGHRPEACAWRSWTTPCSCSAGASCSAGCRCNCCRPRRTARPRARWKKARWCAAACWKPSPAAARRPTPAPTSPWACCR